MMATDRRGTAGIQNGTIPGKKHTGGLHYTLQVGNYTVSRICTLEKDNFYISSRGDSFITFADPSGKFLVSLKTDAALKPGYEFLQCAQNELFHSQSLARFILSDARKGTLESLPFDEGYIKICETTANTKDLTMTFHYRLNHPDTQGPVILKGTAVLPAP